MSARCSCLGVPHDETAHAPTFVDPPLPPDLIAGFVDLHVHSAPDVYGRALDDDEVGVSALRAGCGVVLKNHAGETASRAALLARRHGVDAWGGVVLNHAVGGLNPAAVHAAATMAGGRGRIAWLSTVDAANHVRMLGGAGDGIQAVRNGRPTPELERVVRACADHGIALATGHTGADDAVVVAELCAARDVRCVVTHAYFPIVGCSETHTEALAALGAQLELCAIGTLMGPHAHLAWMRAWGLVDAATCARYVARYGPERFIVSSDLGQSGNPIPADGLRRFVAALALEGLDAEALRVMGAANPRRLLGLSD